MLYSTNMEGRTMKPGPELDDLVAEKVMGRPPQEYADARGRPGWVPPFSTSIAAAWEVVEKVQQLGWMLNGVRCLDRLEHGDWVCIFERRGQPDAYKHSPTAPHAICLAALKAVGAEP
jgi:hypothetical protein